MLNIFTSKYKVYFMTSFSKICRVSSLKIHLKRKKGNQNVRIHKLRKYVPRAKINSISSFGSGSRVYVPPIHSSVKRTVERNLTKCGSSQVGRNRLDVPT